MVLGKSRLAGVPGRGSQLPFGLTFIRCVRSLRWDMERKTNKNTRVQLNCIAFLHILVLEDCMTELEAWRVIASPRCRGGTMFGLRCCTADLSFLCYLDCVISPCSTWPIASDCRRFLTSELLRTTDTQGSCPRTPMHELRAKSPRK